MEQYRSAEIVGGEAIDVGLRAYMSKVYAGMAFAVFITAITSFILSRFMAVALPSGALQLTAFGRALLSGPLFLVIVLATLGVGLYINFKMASMSSKTARFSLYLYAFLFGILISSIFLQYTQASVVQTFFVATASFAGLSLYGYATKRDLSPLASFFAMGFIGLFALLLVSFFVHTSALEFLISIVGLILFAGMTAYDTQKIKSMYYAGSMDGEAVARKTAIASLILYWDFMGIFIYLLGLMGNRR